MDKKSGCYRLSLRFPKPQRESAFVTCRSEQLRWSFGAASMCGVAFCIYSLINLYFSVQANSHFRKVSTAIWLSGIALGLASVISTCPWCHLVREPVRVEIITVVVSAVCIFVVPCMEGVYLARMLGYTFTEIADVLPGSTATDSSFVLGLNLLLSGTHMLMPIRWCALWPLEVLALLVYAVSARKWGGEPSQVIVVNTILLSILSMFACMGKRLSEVYERKGFGDVVRERAKRYKAEHEASVLSAISSSPKDAPVLDISQPDTRSSAGSTANFDKLDAIEKVGQRERWLLPPNDVMVYPRLVGQGGFGIVAFGLFRGMPIAVKASKKQYDTASDITRLAETCAELRILRHVRHPNIVQLLGACLDISKQQLVIVMELVLGPSLRKFIEDVKPEAAERFGSLLGVCSALWYLHFCTPPILHGDLKPDNIRIARDGGGICPKLLDFGLSRKMTASLGIKAGTWNWMPPELAECHVTKDKELKVETASVDVYSFGLICYFVVTEKIPRLLPEGSKLVHSLQWDLNFDQHLAWQIKPVTDACVVDDPSARPGMDATWIKLSAAGDEYPAWVPKLRSITWHEMHLMRGSIEMMEKLAVQGESIERDVQSRPGDITTVSSSQDTHTAIRSSACCGVEYFDVTILVSDLSLRILKCAPVDAELQGGTLEHWISVRQYPRFLFWIQSQFNNTLNEVPVESFGPIKLQSHRRSLYNCRDVIFSEAFDCDSDGDLSCLVRFHLKA